MYSALNTPYKGKGDGPKGDTISPLFFLYVMQAFLDISLSNYHTSQKTRMGTSLLVKEDFWDKHYC
jgi:hypothetical protein